MNEKSPASDSGLAYWLARDLQGMNGNEGVASRVARLSQTFQKQFQGEFFPDDGIVPAHTIYTSLGTMMIGVLGSRTFLELNAFFAAANVRATQANHFCNAAAVLAGGVIKAHADAISDTQTNTILYGHSLGGAICQAMAIANTWSLPADYVHTCCTFGQPRQFQGDLGTLAVGDFSFARWNALGDTIPHFVPHADEAPTATAFTDDLHRSIWSESLHVGQGITLGGSGVDQFQDVPPLALPIAEFSLWNFLLNNDSPTAVAHRIDNYVTLLENYSVPNQTRAYTPIGAAFVLQGVFVEDAPRLQPPAARAAIVQAAFDNTIVTRGSQPEAGPFYAINRAGNWQCEFEGNPVTTGSGKRNAQAMARRMNAAWRQWWRAKVSSTDNLAYAIDQAFPS